jgi:hypothetical protein
MLVGCACHFVCMFVCLSVFSLASTGVEISSSFFFRKSNHAIVRSSSKLDEIDGQGQGHAKRQNTSSVITSANSFGI